MEAEGSFGTYIVSQENSKVGYFEITQNDDSLIIEAIRKYLKISNNVVIHSNNNYRLKTTNVRG
ncbi:hypothetical protein HGI15_22080, partial [Modestobacter lapidis]|nr:hypothetical protein [Modestobacter lapidis]